MTRDVDIKSLVVGVGPGGSLSISSAIFDALDVCSYLST